jgi:hypothetical protein
VASAEQGDGERIRDLAVQIVGAEAFAAAFATGAADPQAVVAEVRAEG